MAGALDFTNQNIQDTYQRLVQVSGSSYYDGTGSLLDLSGGAQDLQSVVEQGASANIAITSSAETAISASGTGSFGYIKAINAIDIEGSPFTRNDIDTLKEGKPLSTDISNLLVSPRNDNTFIRNSQAGRMALYAGGTASIDLQSTKLTLGGLSNSPSTPTLPVQIISPLTASIISTSILETGNTKFESAIQSRGLSINVGVSSQPTSSNIFLVKIEDDTKFTINNQGVTILGEQTSTPTAVAGGIYYSSSNFFVGIE